MGYQVTVVMPALNEEGNIVAAVENVVMAFRRLSVEGEILIVNDGSTDRTGELIETLKTRHSFVRSLRHDTPQGVGRSFWEGAEAATGDSVTMLPGDAENDAYEILRYLPLLKHVDIVIPFVFNRGARSAIRQTISLLYRFLVNVSFGTSLNYFNGTVLYRRSVLKGLNLQSSGFFYQTELLVKTLRRGYLYAEVPCGLRHRADGKSKALTFRSLRRVIRDYLLTLSTLSSGAKTPLDSQSVSEERIREFSPTAGQTSPFLVSDSA